MFYAIKEGELVSFDASMANRHGLVAGATGTGKTVTIKLLCEEFSKQGVPVFITDIKGDLSGFIEAGQLSEKLKARLDDIGAPTPEFSAFPVNFWDLLKTNGIPLRTTVSEMGPLLMSRLLGLNDTQSGVLYALFKIADEQGLLLLDFKDLQEMLKYAYENAGELSKEYGNIQKQSLGAIQRSLLVLEQQGGAEFFQEPAFDIRDLMQRDPQGMGVINVLDASKIYHSPDLYSAFILWLLSELFEQLDEVGDQPLPKLVFFFEEAHLLFQNASRVLLERIEQVVKLVRSKGVGIFFVTQNPRDIPDKVLAQLGNKFQHALRAFTPAEQKVIRSVAEGFRSSGDLNVAEEMMNLRIGEALVSTLDDRGAPTEVQKVFILAPASNMKPADRSAVDNAIRNSYFYNKYEKTFDSESAYEILQRRYQEQQQVIEQQRAEKEKPEEKGGGLLGNLTRGSSRGDSAVDRMIKNTMGSIGTQVGRAITRGIFGNLLKR